MKGLKDVEIWTLKFGTINSDYEVMWVIVHINPDHPIYPIERVELPFNLDGPVHYCRISSFPWCFVLKPDPQASTDSFCKLPVRLRSRLPFSIPRYYFGDVSNAT